MKKLILILAIVTLAVMASGCTDNQSTNKTYSSNGISFTYPGNWSEMSTSSIQSIVGSTTNVLVSVGEGDDKVFAVGKVNLQSGQKAVTPEKWGSTYKSVMKSGGLQIVESKSMAVDGNDAYLVTVKENSSGMYLTDVYFKDNEIPYIAVYASKTNDQQILNSLLNSLKIS